MVEKSRRSFTRCPSYERLSDVADYIPHTPEEVAAMLEFLGLDSLDQLFAHIPASVRLSAGLDMAPGLSEPDVAAVLSLIHI